MTTAALHWIAALLVLIEALNKLDRMPVHQMARQGWRERVETLLKMAAWAPLALGGAGVVVAPLFGWPRGLADTLLVAGLALLLVRGRVQEQLFGEARHGSRQSDPPSAATHGAANAVPPGGDAWANITRDLAGQPLPDPGQAALDAALARLGDAAYREQRASAARDAADAELYPRAADPPPRPHLRARTEPLP